MIEYTVKVFENGNKEWHLNGKLHREDGPAVEYSNGDKYWYINGKLHREDGPAVEYSNGSKCWYLNGEKLTEKEFNAQMNECNARMRPQLDGTTVNISGVEYKLYATIGVSDE